MTESSQEDLRRQIVNEIYSLSQMKLEKILNEAIEESGWTLNLPRARNLAELYTSPNFKGDSNSIAILGKLKNLNIYVIHPIGLMGKVTKAKVLKDNALVLLKENRGYHLVFPDKNRKRYLFKANEIYTLMKEFNSHQMPMVIKSDEREFLASYYSKFPKTPENQHIYQCKTKEQDLTSDFDKNVYESTRKIMHQDPEFKEYQRKISQLTQLEKESLRQNVVFDPKSHRKKLVINRIRSTKEWQKSLQQSDEKINLKYKEIKDSIQEKMKNPQ